MNDRHATPPPLDRFVDADWLASLAAASRVEDLGPDGVDLTSELTLPGDVVAPGRVTSRQPGVIAGLAAAPFWLEAYRDLPGAHALRWTPLARDGERIEAGAAIAELTGPARAVLSLERPLLNLVGALSGVATLTRRFVDAVAHTPARILETRKTLPGYRGLAKYACACGGATTHRMGLYDAVLVKDNHLSGLTPSEVAHRVASLLEASRSRSPRPAFVMVEVDQLEAVLTLASRPDVVLLDNFAPAEVRRARRLRDATCDAGPPQLEVSGGVTLDTVAAYAEAGADRISVGALTHSAGVLDVGLDVEMEPRRP